MKNIEVIVRPVRFRAAAESPDPPLERGQTMEGGPGRTPSGGDLTVQVLVSDEQAKQVIGDLLETDNLADDTDFLIKEFIDRELQIAGRNANDLYGRVFAQVERELIRRVLHDCEGVQTKAASRLGIDRNRLYKLRQKYGV
jgi:DNA-binding protein Fis